MGAQSQPLVANSHLWSTKLHRADAVWFFKRTARAEVMQTQTVKLYYTLTVSEHKTCRIVLQVGDYMWLWLSQYSAEEATNSSGNNLGLDRLSNLFIEAVPSQQTYLYIHLISLNRHCSFLSPYRMDTKFKDTGDRCFCVLDWNTPCAFGCECTWSCQYTVSKTVTWMKSSEIGTFVDWGES